MLKIPYSKLVHLNVLLLFVCFLPPFSYLFVFFLPQFSFSLIPQAVETDGIARGRSERGCFLLHLFHFLSSSTTSKKIFLFLPHFLPHTCMAELSSGKCFLVEAWSGTPEALLGLQGSHRAGLGSRAWQKVSEGCREGLGALLLGCEKWECFIHSITKDIICPLYSLLFQLVTSNVVVMSSTMHSFHVHMLYFWLLSSQLCKHSPHKSPQPTHLPLTQHSHNEKSELNEPSFSNSCTQPGP